MEFILFLSLLVCSQADIQGRSSVYDNFPDNLSINEVPFGYGYNTINLKPANNKVVDIQKSWDDLGLDSAGFIESSFKIQLCETREELFEQFSGGLSQPETSLGIAPDNTGEFLKQTDINILDSVLIATVEAITDTKSVHNAKLTGEAQALALSGDYAKFVALYGTHYLRKIFIGGKMLLVMKFSSSTPRGKAALDKQLKSDVVGLFSGPALFTSTLQRLHQQDHEVDEVLLYAQGTGVPVPLRPDMKDGIRYAFEFSKDLLKYKLVRGVEYTALWTVPDYPRELRQYIIQQQMKTDTIVQISADLLEVKMSIADIQILRKQQNAYISNLGWSQLNQTLMGIEQAIETLRQGFNTRPLSEFNDLIKEGEKSCDKYKSDVKDIITGEKKYNYGQVLTLRNEQYRLYFANSTDSYPSLWYRDPDPLVVKETTGNKIVRYMVGYYHITSGRASTALQNSSNYYLCMGQTSKYVFWSEDQSENEMCQWRLVHATDTTKSVMEYGDSIMLYNRSWKSYIMGVQDGWVGACKAEHGETWYIGREDDHF